MLLASASERRHAILRRLGLEFEIRPADVDETPEAGLAPRAIALDLARRKQRRVARQFEAGTVISADTLVVAEGERLLGKPESAAEGAAMLRTLSGTTHEVITGIALLHLPSGLERADAVVTRVTMRPLTAAEIADYVASGEGFGKAGGYAIQETADRFVERLDGSFDNVVGLPSERFAELLADLGRAVAEASSQEG